jgi:bifunctional ADP-heptose synthase (sugar kinase/adenylyltransferase)
MEKYSDEPMGTPQEQESDKYFDLNQPKGNDKIEGAGLGLVNPAAEEFDRLAKKRETEKKIEQARKDLKKIYENNFKKPL